MLTSHPWLILMRKILVNTECINLTSSPHAVVVKKRRKPYMSPTPSFGLGRTQRWWFWADKSPRGNQ